MNLTTGIFEIFLYTKKILTVFSCVEIWDLRAREKKGEMRYLLINEFGEAIPVDDPVVSIAANSDFSLAYAFMGQAAYCIDTEKKMIVQQIPISETCVSGCVNEETGTVGVITEPGYLSLWSPKFYERIGSHEFLKFNTESAYLTYENQNNRLILVLPDDELILLNSGPCLAKGSQKSVLTPPLLDKVFGISQLI